jgi:hypothetical protein
MSEKSKKLVPVNVNQDTGAISIPAENVPVLTRDQSRRAHNTNLHSLQVLEMLLLSGTMDTKDMLKALEMLAKYQFAPAAHTKQESNEKKVEDWLEEIDGGD